MDSNKNDLKREYAEVGIKALKGDSDGKFELSFSSEEPYGRWFGIEILDHKAGAVDLSRLNTIGCILFNHDRDSVLGKIEKAWISEMRGKAVVSFDDDDFSEKIKKKVVNETLKGVSVSYTVDVWETVKEGAKSSDGKWSGPCEIARKWTPYEVSIVSVPADPTVGVGRGKVQTDEKPLYYSRRLNVNKNYLEGENGN